MAFTPARMTRESLKSAGSPFVVSATPITSCRF
jgi:hypothetical protein